MAPCARVWPEWGPGNAATADSERGVSLPARANTVPGFDPEDIFGLRRALRGLPEELHADFIERWVELGELTGCDVEAVRRGARETARRCALSGTERMRTAWTTVAGAMGAYLEWRDQNGSLSFS